MTKRILSLFAFLIIVTFLKANPETPYLVVVSMDGFRWDYPDSVSMPNLSGIAARGVKARMIPSFPSVTFPNHYSMATGLYPDHHGLVNNTFYDSTLRLTYKISNRTAVGDGRFYGGEPIWVTAEKQNVKSACFYWVGSEAEIQGVRPSFWKIYGSTITYRQRIDSVVSWLQLPEDKRPHLVMLYFDQPDKSGHETGPFSSETRRKVSELDTSVVKYLVEQLGKLTIGNQINLIVTSDHGMSAISKDRRVLLDDYIQRNWCRRVNGHNPVVMLDAEPGYSDSIVNRLSLVPHIKAWRKADVPKRLHWGTNARIGDIVVLADSSYAVGRKDESMENGGAHGYDNQNTDMHAIFYAAGPAFKKGYTRTSFENVNLYSIMTYILGLKPAPSDGNIDFVKDILNLKNE